MWAIKNVPLKVSTWISIISFALFVARFAVLFAESWSLVRSERAADSSLLHMCSKGVADESAKFRALCMKTKAEQAAPLLLKAALRAIRTAFTDFVEMFQTPSRVILLILFCVSGLALPVVKAASAVVAAHMKHDTLERLHGIDFSGEEDQEACSVVVLKSGTSRGLISQMRSLPMRVSRRRSTNHGVPLMIEEDDGEADACDGWKHCM